MKTSFLYKCCTSVCFVFCIIVNSVIWSYFIIVYYQLTSCVYVLKSHCGPPNHIGNHSNSNPHPLAFFVRSGIAYVGCCVLVATADGSIVSPEATPPSFTALTTTISS